jgi:DNA-directed RNA polymerase II subunit RPB7
LFLDRQRCIEELEGISLGRHGYIVSIIEIKDQDIVIGKIDNDTGAVSVLVAYQALLLRPFKNEVMDAVVDTATSTGFFCSCGPLQIFVSRHNMEREMHYDNARGDCWVSEDQEVEIKQGSNVRLRILRSVELAVVSLSYLCAECY